VRGRLKEVVLNPSPSHTGRVALQPYVPALGWLNTSAHTSPMQHVLPTDLFMVTVFRRDEASSSSNCHSHELEIYLTLLRTQPIRFKSHLAGQLGYGLLTPSGVLKLLRAPLNGALNQRIDLAQFSSPEEYRALRDRLLDAADADQRTRLLGKWLEERITRRHNYTTQQSRVAHAASCLQSCTGPLDLPGLCAQLAVTQRQLERDFRVWLGISPAAYARIVRFQRAAQAIAAGAGLADAAFAHHFSDQAHFNRSFRQLGEMTPKEFAARARRPQRAKEAQALAGRILMVDALG
jgi:AraC-like DNA-binding protein